MTNEKDLDSNILPITNAGSKAAIISNCQLIRGNDLPIQLMPIKQGGGGGKDKEEEAKIMDVWGIKQEIHIWESKEEKDNIIEIFIEKDNRVK